VLIPTFERIANGLVSQPWILGLVILIFLGVAAFLVWVIWHGKRQSGARGVQKQIELVLGQQSSILPTSRMVKVDEGKINFPADVSTRAPAPGNGSNRPRVQTGSLPPALLDMEPSRLQLRVYRSGDPALLGKTIPVSPLPFIIGSQNSHLSIIRDPLSVRRFAQISYDQVLKRYLIVDLQSPNVVWLNGVRIAPSLPSPLLPGMMIALGKDTQLLFG
jgi:hypothetical protein